MTKPDPTSGDRVSVALLWHFQVGADEDWDEDGSERLVGIYASDSSAEAAADRLRRLPEFRDWPDGFRIFDSWLDHDSWTDGFIALDGASVALDDDASGVAGAAQQGAARGEPVELKPGLALFRVLHRTGGDTPDEKVVGTYTDRARAEACIARVKGKPGFRNWPGGFVVVEYRLDEDDIHPNSSSPAP